MKTKIVLWGERGENEKVLLALELNEKENKVLLYIFKLDVATEDFYQSMMDKWKEDKALDFPEHEIIERPLSISDSLLPENIKVDRTDIVSRAQAEWHFVVLSSKLYEMYKGELDELKEKIEKVRQYDNALWEEAKTFWTKVQNQVIEKNLFREHSTILKDRTNNIFEKLKDLRKEVQKEFETQSAEIAQSFQNEIKEVQERISKGMGLKPLFEELKKLQDKFYNTEFVKEHRKSVWDALDATFKALKEKKFGEEGPNKPAFGKDGRLHSRFDGLLEAIKKMEISIKKDREEIAFQSKKINETDGQLEMQIRQAKLKMVEERIKSKDEKLKDMYKTKTELEAKLASEKNREHQMLKNAKKEEVKETIKQKIADEIKAAETDRAELSEQLETKASEINESKGKKGKKKESILTSISNAVEETIDNISETAEDIIDNVKAVAEVIEDKIEDAIDNLKKDEEEKKDSPESETNDVATDAAEEIKS